MPDAVRNELLSGRLSGYDVPDPDIYPWLKIVNPQSTPSEWLVTDLGIGEIAAMALALENPQHVILLDEMLARRTAQSAGLQVWGTLKILLEAKSQGVISQLEPYVSNLTQAGMWISTDIRKRILALAGES